MKKIRLVKEKLIYLTKEEYVELTSIIKTLKVYCLNETTRWFGHPPPTQIFNKINDANYLLFQVGLRYKGKTLSTMDKEDVMVMM